MFNWILSKIIGTQNEREIKKLRPLVEKINSFEPEVQKLSNAEHVPLKQRMRLIEVHEGMPRFHSMNESITAVFIIYKPVPYNNASNIEQICSNKLTDR